MNVAYRQLPTVDGYVPTAGELEQLAVRGATAATQATAECEVAFWTRYSLGMALSASIVREATEGEAFRLERVR